VGCLQPVFFLFMVLYQMATVFYLHQQNSDVPEHNRWLHESELGKLQELRFPKRRMDWRLSRWTGKSAICALRGLSCTDENLSAMAILAADDGAPELFRDGTKSALSISLSHSKGRGLAALTSDKAAFGCDLEHISEQILTFIPDYLTGHEMNTVRAAGSDQMLAATLIWSAKESALKALRAGLRLDTRSVEVEIQGEFRYAAAWQGLSVGYASKGISFNGVWRVLDGFVVTMVAQAETVVPSRLLVA
jgi:4'-phosphopantetheinyl transferase